MPVWNAVLLSLIAGLATAVGGGLVAFMGEVKMRTYDTMLGFAAGIMTGIATLGLIHEALVQDSVWIAMLGVAVGAGILFLLDRFLPHEHEQLSFICTNPIAYRRGMLLFAAMALHNMPEGLAVGTSYTAQPSVGLLLALAIAFHNIPEGVALAAPFRACGMPWWRCILWAAVAGLVEPAAAFFGSAFVTLFDALLPFSLAFAGGAMLYVVSDELIPESHSHGFEHQATFGFVVGFVVLLVLYKLV